MSGILFACDLDNTLLYSYKHRRPGDICVEMLDGREQGFMTPRTVTLLRDLRRCVNIVPVTTRSAAQYGRIAWPEGCAPGCAVAANGASLLKDGRAEESWRKASEAVIAPYRDEFAALMPEFKDRTRFLRCRVVDDAYLFVYCGGGVSPMECVRAYEGCSRLDVVCSGQKVYFLPPELNKGGALRRLKALLRPAAVIAAGDSAMDAPMLNEADLAIIPAFFQESMLHTPYVKARGDEGPFAEFVLETVRERAAGALHENVQDA